MPIFVESRDETQGLSAPRVASSMPTEGSPMARLICCVNFEPLSTASCEANVGPLKPQGPEVFEHGIGHAFLG